MIRRADLKRRANKQKATGIDTNITLNDDLSLEDSGGTSSDETDDE